MCFDRVFSRGSAVSVCVCFLLCGSVVLVEWISVCRLFKLRFRFWCVFLCGFLCFLMDFRLPSNEKKKKKVKSVTS